jgi:hypothetical protein
MVGAVRIRMGAVAGASSFGVSIFICTCTQGYHREDIALNDRTLDKTDDEGDEDDCTCDDWYPNIVLGISG